MLAEQRFRATRIVALGWLLIALLPAIAAAADQEEKTTPHYDPIKQEVEGWTVHVDPALADGGEHQEEGKQALKMLANHLQRVAILVPEPALGEMKKVEIWLERQNPLTSAMQYHPDAGWLVRNGFDKRLAKKVHIPKAAELTSRGQLLKHPAVVLHELAHAYHDQVLGFDEPRVLEAFKTAKESGSYEEVLLFNGDKVRHYGLTNHKEYFAEATEAFFYRNDFYPFVRAELKQHDPRMEKTLQEIWKGR
ncbi:metallopeptidase [Blastopirellula marina]|uniref:Metallopeptidase n=1 Tax=Blastopirellula marina TaxID=124 RepID=A0A2S8F2W5_9BACT|nr:metallopeptidase [Blastopirellula marina]PQO26483.1 metallopeptidase [Blastopirellula marina]PTL40796.1 metallopeptidase [Blastopirellula marina]